MKTTLESKIQYLKGIGPQRAKLFNKIGIKTIEDIFYHFPRRYQDRSSFVSVCELKEGMRQSVRAQVLAGAERNSWRRRGFNILEVAVMDSTGKVSCIWFNQPYLKNYFKPGQEVIFFGRVERYSGRLQMNSPEFEIISDDETELLDTGKIIPIYTLPEGLTQRHFRKILNKCLEEYLPQVVDVLPYNIRTKKNLLNLAKSLGSIHFPEDLAQSEQAYHRLAFEEFFLFQILVSLKKLKRKQRRGLPHKVKGDLSGELFKSLPFELTKAQCRVIEEIKKDMASDLPMSRLLQGDVGSGKTIVALIASVFAIQGGYQVAFMVPTELLAAQHFQKCVEFLKHKVEIGLLTGSLTVSKKEKIYDQIKQGSLQLVIGTHSLLQEKVRFKGLGLVVIDEQHKFGVAQRAVLPKSGNPDVLIMTATPIPRTLAITLYGDLDISVIDELPPSRKPVKTQIFAKDQIKDVWRIVEEEIKQTRQAYIIYPIIEESYALDLRAANQMYKVLKNQVFPDVKVGLIHGQLKSQEQNEIMTEFKNGNIDILVATTVLEIGIDVPNATLMVIEHAERFGLSQLHQLRGRIGRGPHESRCILVSHPVTDESRMRIKAMLHNSDGFHIAEEDLKIRGPGEFFGKRQHGLSELRIANPVTQLQLLQEARKEASELVDKDSKLESRQNVVLRRKLQQRFPSYKKYIGVG